MSDEVIKVDDLPSRVEQVLVGGDLAALSVEERVVYYNKVCESIGLNPLTKPFDYIKLNGRLTLYARKDATDQLRKRYNVSITKLERETTDKLCIFTAYAELANGRKDTSTGVVHIGSLSGDQIANAIMKAETKAKRRVTLSICGLGMLDETEAETVGSFHKAPTPADSLNAALEAPEEPAPMPEAQPEPVEDDLGWGDVVENDGLSLAD